MFLGLRGGYCGAIGIIVAVLKRELLMAQFSIWEVGECLNSAASLMVINLRGFVLSQSAFH